MISATIFPGRYIQGYGAINKLAYEIARLGKIGYLICSPTVYVKLLPSFREELGNSVKLRVEKFGGECSYEEIDRLVWLAGKTKDEVIIGMGRGKVIDTAKSVAAKLEAHLITVPTVASSDAPCSAASVIHTPEGLIDGLIMHPRNPDVVLVDTKIIADAPVRFLVAGMGDALSTQFEAESCRNKRIVRLPSGGEISSLTGYALARLCYQTLLDYGPTAKKACETHSVITAVEYIIETNTLLSGLGVENCGLATAHGLQGEFTVLKEAHNYLHGELVAFCTLVSLFLTNKSRDLIEEVYSFCSSVGSPTNMAEIGLANISNEALIKVAQATVVEGNPIHNEPIPVTVDSLIAAIKKADYEGK